MLFKILQYNRLRLRDLKQAPEFDRRTPNLIGIRTAEINQQNHTESRLPCPTNIT